MSTHGGKRENAGRPRGQGKFGEPTKIMRIPESQTRIVENFLEALQRKRLKAKDDIAVAEVNVEEFFTPIINEQPTHLPLFST